MFQRSLICTDFSDGLQRLVHFVPTLAAGGMTHLVFLHSLQLSGEKAVPRPDAATEKKARDRLSTALQSVPADVDVAIDVQWSKPIDHILNATKTHQSELIVMGMPIRNLLDEKLFGSTTMGLCQRRSAPILILRPQLVSTYTAEELELRCRHLFRYLLVPYDGSEAANYTIQQIKQQIQRTNSQSVEVCVLCWIVDEVSRSGELEALELRQAEEKLADVKAELEGVGLMVETQVRQGNPATQLLAIAEERDVSAIALSSNSLGKPMGWSANSFAGDLIRRSWYPVLYFPPT